MSEFVPLVVQVADRRVNAWRGGADTGLVMVFHTGTPSPPVYRAALDRTASALGLRLVTYARPGYSGSTRQPGRSVADAAGDTAAVLDALGQARFVTVGHSGGGPHALACAALLPTRCLAAVSLAGVTPFDAEGVEWLAGMADENGEEFTTALAGEAVLRPYLARYVQRFADVTSDDVAASLAGLVSDVDRTALTGEFADMAARSFRRSAVDGVDGWIDDDLAFVKPWGFDVEEIDVPVAVWQGRHDRMVPFAHGQWLRAHIPTSAPRLLDDEGHISLVTGRLETSLVTLWNCRNKAAWTRVRLPRLPGG